MYVVGGMKANKRSSSSKRSSKSIKQPLKKASASGKTKYCSECGSKIESNAKFCSNCGKQF